MHSVRHHHDLENQQRGCIQFQKLLKRRQLPAITRNDVRTKLGSCASVSMDMICLNGIPLNVPFITRTVLEGRGA